MIQEAMDYAMNLVSRLMPSEVTQEEIDGLYSELERDCKVFQRYVESGNKPHYRYGKIIAEKGSFRIFDTAFVELEKVFYNYKRRLKRVAKKGEQALEKAYTEEKAPGDISTNLIRLTEFYNACVDRRSQYI